MKREQLSFYILRKEQIKSSDNISFLSVRFYLFDRL